MTRYRIVYDVEAGFWLDTDSIEEAAYEAIQRLDAEYPGIAFRIELEDE